MKLTNFSGKFTKVYSASGKKRQYLPFKGITFILYNLQQVSSEKIFRKCMIDLFQHIKFDFFK